MATVGSVENQVFEFEGFNIQVQNNAGGNARSDASMAMEYPKIWTQDGVTVQYWKEMVWGNYFDEKVEVLKNDGTFTHGKTLLQTVRRDYE